MIIFPTGLEAVVHDTERSAYVEQLPPSIQLAQESLQNDLSVVIGKNYSEAQKESKNNFSIEERLDYLKLFHSITKKPVTELDEKTIRDTMESINSEFGKDLLKVYNSGNYGKILVKDYLEKCEEKWKDFDYELYKQSFNEARTITKRYNLPQNIERELADGLTVRLAGIDYSLIALERKLGNVKRSLIDDLLYEIVRRKEKDSKSESDIERLRNLIILYTYSLIKNNSSQKTLEEWLRLQYNDVSVKAYIKSVNDLERRGFENELKKYQEKRLEPPENPKQNWILSPNNLAYHKKEFVGHMFHNLIRPTTQQYKPRDKI